MTITKEWTKGIKKKQKNEFDDSIKAFEIKYMY